MRLAIVVLAASSLVKADAPAANQIALTRVFPRAGQIGLFVAAADGTNEHPLLSAPDLAYDAAWAPNGQSIVFTSERNGSADLFQVKPDGSGLIQLTSDPSYEDQAAFSPDSKRLVFVSTRGGGFANLWTLDLATKKIRALTSGAGGDYRPSWSPDGNWIAFSSGRGNDFAFAEGRWERLQLADIYIVRPDGSGLKRITSGKNFCGSPKWTSDSRKLVAYCMTGQQTMDARTTRTDSVSATRLVMIDTKSGSLSEIPVGAGMKINPSLLPGNVVAYIRKDSAEAGIYYTGGQPVNQRGPQGAVRVASWSPDGKQVVFHRRLAVQPPAMEPAFSRNAGYELRLTSGMPVFSPSGTQFLRSGRSTTFPGMSAITLTTVDTGQSAVLYEEKSRNVLVGGWSPRGDKVVFGIGGFPAFFDGFHSEFLKPGDRVETGARLAMVNPDGTGFQELTADADNSAFPSFAPDGKRLVFRTFSKDGQGLRIMNLETKTITTLTAEYDNFPLWSPREDLILFARLVGGTYKPGATYDLFTIKADGTSLKRLTDGKGNDAHMGWSPDGESIVFASSRMGFKDEVAYTDAPQAYGEIFVMRKDGTHVEQLTDNQWEDGTPAWSPRAYRAAQPGGH